MILTCKEFVSHHSYPYNRKKAEQTDTLFWDASESWGPALKGNYFTSAVYPRERQLDGLSNLWLRLTPGREEGQDTVLKVTAPGLRPIKKTNWF